MSTNSELIAKQLAGALAVKNIWGSIMYNALNEGLVGDGVTDDTTALQNLINKAIAAGRRTIFFPHTSTGGEYYVTSLTDDDQVVFLGENASFVGGYVSTINQFGDSVSKAVLDALAADVAQRGINVTNFGVVPNTGTDQTSGIQAALTYLATLYGGDTTAGAGYVGWYESELIFPAGVYLCGLVTVPAHVKMVGIGQAVIQSVSGTSAVPAGQFVDNTVVNIYVERLTFEYFDTVFTLPTGNSDFSFMTFDQCKFAYCNVGIDTVSYAESRSTTFKMTRCTVSYGVTTLCKVYTDKSTFKENWFNHSVNSIFMYLDSFSTFKDNVWVATTPGVNKVYISFSGSDQTRSLKFVEERFGAEAGQCPIVVVNNVNAGNINDAYRQQGISFEGCFLSSGSSYNPDSVGAIKACVVLRPTVSALEFINYVSFKDCSFAPDLSGGVVQTYNVSDITTLAATDFVIDFDYASAVSASKGTNIPTSSNLQRYVHMPILARKTYIHSKGSGKLVVSNTATTGQKKASFQFNRTWPGSYHTPATYLLTCIGQGDSSFPNLAYGYMSVYILTISAQNGATTFSKISWTKLHGAVGGASGGANADIPTNGVFWGTGDTGVSTMDETGTDTVFDVTITFGTRIQIGNVYLQPLYDFSLLT